jgi:hypothetical protein
MGTKEWLQIVIGARESSDMIAVQQAEPVAAGDLVAVGQHGGEGWGVAFLVFRHGSEQGLQVTFDPVPIKRFGIGHYLGDPLHPVIGGPHHRPQRSGLG